MLDWLRYWRRTGSAKVSGSRTVSDADAVGQPGRSEAQGHADAGDRARDLAQWENAVQHYAKALELQPDWVAIRVQYGHMLKESGDYTGAEKEYLNALTFAPGDSDVHLNLGHALKLQRRLPEARQAYWQAVGLDPTNDAARQELRTLGVSAVAIEQHVRAMRPAALVDGADTRVGERALEPGQRERPSIYGCVQEIGRHHVAGFLYHVDAADLPLNLVCRARDTVVGTLVVECDAVLSVKSSVDLAIPFKMELGVEPGVILSIAIEPTGQALEGSPFVLPGNASGDLIARIERLELMVGQPPLRHDEYVRLERTLARSVVAMAADQIEQLLQGQRERFERQLLALEGTGAAARRHERADGQMLLELSASDPFPGMGWSATGPDRDGRLVRWVMGQAHLGLSNIGAGAFLFVMTIGTGATDRALDAVSLSLNGVRLDQWLTQAKDGLWLVIASLPRHLLGNDGGNSLIVRDNFIDSDHGNARKGLAVSRIAFIPVGAFDVDNADLADCIIHGAPSIGCVPSGGLVEIDRHKTLFFCKSLESKCDMLISLDVADDKASLASVDALAFSLNGTRLQRSAESVSDFVAPSDLWHTDAANLIAIDIDRSVSLPLCMRRIAVSKL